MRGLINITTCSLFHFHYFYDDFMNESWVIDHQGKGQWSEVCLKLIRAKGIKLSGNFKKPTKKNNKCMNRHTKSWAKYLE